MRTIRHGVGVVIPMHNSAATIGRALRSVELQTVPVREVVVVDDHSEDAGPAIVEAWPDPRVRMVRSTERGAAVARNTGVAALTSELVAFLDSDDVWYPDKLEHQLPLLTDDVAIVGALVHYLGESGEVLGTHVPFADWDQATEATRAAESLPVPTTSFLLRRTEFMHAGGFDTSFRQSEDFEFVVRLLQDGRRIVWPRGRALSGYVLSTTGVSRLHYREQFLAAELVRAKLQGRTTASYEEWLEDPDITALTRQKMLSGDRYRRAAVARGTNDRVGYVANGVLALALDPIGAARKLHRRGNPSEHVTPKSPPPQIYAEFVRQDGDQPETAAIPTHEVAGLHLAEDPARIPTAVAELWQQEQRTVVLHAAHVTSLNARHDPDFVAAFNRADFAYADGISWTLVARAGGKRTDKIATTDLAPATIQEMRRVLGREVRAAVLGGPDGIAKAAVPALQEMGVDVVLADHGFHDDWDPVLDELRGLAPDVVVVGLGMPLEALWTEAHRSRLPASVVITCGGWLRLLANVESRAPELVRRFELEWAYRLLTDGARTSGRYRKGAGEVVRAVVDEASNRFAS